MLGEVRTKMLPLETFASPVLDCRILMLMDTKGFFKISQKRRDENVVARNPQIHLIYVGAVGLPKEQCISQSERYPEIFQVELNSLESSMRLLYGKNWWGQAYREFSLPLAHPHELVCSQLK